MSIKLNCLACGYSMTLGEAYEDYEGDIRCWGCRVVLEVALSEGRLRSMRNSTGGLPGRSQEPGNFREQPPEAERALAANGQKTR